jgi:hypothetical protein
MNPQSPKLPFSAVLILEMIRPFPLMSFKESSHSENMRDRSKAIMSGSYSLGYKLASRFSWLSACRD